MQATVRCNTGYQVPGRTPADKQKSMSLEDNQNIYQSISCKLEFGRRDGGVKEEAQSYMLAHVTWWATCRRRRLRTAVQLVTDCEGGEVYLSQG